MLLISVKIETYKAQLIKVLNKILFLLVFGNLFSQNTSLVSEAKILPTIDGDVINDKAWEGLSTIKTFTQKSPDEGNL